MKPKNSMKMRRHNTGVTLIEVLVALVVMSIGLLTAVSLQLVSKRNNFDAGQRSQAARLVGDMAERMRANRAFAALKIYVSQGAKLGQGSITAEPSPTCTGTSSCSAEELAAHDLWLWEQEMDGAFEKVGTSKTGGLAFPTACVTGPGDGSSGVYTITMAWRGGVEIPTNTAVTCGTGDANYGGAGEFRRTFSLQVFITN